MNANPRPLAAALTLGLALGLAACRSPTPPAPPAPTTPAFGGTDLAWIEITIAMDEELLPLLDLTPANGSSAQAKDLSAQVKAFTTDELGTLRQLHDEAGLPAENPHKGMPMPGMVTPAVLASAKALTGKAFDEMLTTTVREHLEQGQKLAVSEQSSGTETRTKELAARIVETRKATLKNMPEDF
ncbi:hypothetical protein Acy02nite_03370 [Actinoplanes cyaneus]|uniref:DUF305 domain-containing protein n=1 Tax=Actinoplanes cyaneus TaxID=52696 RepID=A0A919IDN5_9ACTN|nr:DUF305 domain-containing protein [Actinoplanes cyaneus]MCW2136174.1 protein of unknown function (DUF305) [Actinoplanes cyaneus]GID62456.1 hypothetical protein Acy02nite_03370 [Actinoplanes cyaneus]